MSSMKAETPVIRGPAHNLDCFNGPRLAAASSGASRDYGTVYAQPATPVDGVPTTTTADVEPRRDFAELY